MTENKRPESPSWAAKRKRLLRVSALLLGAGLVLMVPLLLRHSRASKAPDKLSQLTQDLLREPSIYHRWIDRERRRTSRPGAVDWLPIKIRKKTSDAIMKLEAQRSRARFELRALGTNAWPVLPDLLPGLEGYQFVPIRWSVVDVLVGTKAWKAPQFQEFRAGLRHKTQAAPAFAWVLVRPDEYGLSYGAAAREMALVCLLACPPTPQATGDLLTYLRQSKDDYRCRALAVAALGRHGTGEVVVCDQIKQIALRQEEYPEVLRAAYRALANIAPQDPEVHALLREALESPNALARLGGAEGLWTCGRPPSEALSVIRPMLGHKLKSVRRAALEAIEGMGSAGAAAEEDIRQLVEDPDPAIRNIAINVLRSLAGKPQSQS